MTGLLLRLILAGVLSAGADGDVTSSHCHDLPLFEHYRRAGLATRLDDGRWQLSLRADRHAVSCGAPDGYGTLLRVLLSVREVSGRCRLEDVTVERTAFGDAKYRPGLDPEPIRFLGDAARVNLSDESIERLTLRNSEFSEALVLLPNNFFYFPDVTPDGVLHERLETDHDDSEKCCWGGDSAYLEWFDR